jgi:hypothetical protein
MMAPSAEGEPHRAPLWLTMANNCGAEQLSWLVFALEFPLRPLDRAGDARAPAMPIAAPKPSGSRCPRSGRAGESEGLGLIQSHCANVVPRATASNSGRRASKSG